MLFKVQWVSCRRFIPFAISCATKWIQVSAVNSGKSIFTDRSKVVLLFGSLLLFTHRVCHVFLSVHCSLVVTCLKRADLSALLYMMFYCVYVTFPCSVLGLVWCLMVSIPGRCHLSYFYQHVLIVANFLTFTYIGILGQVWYLIVSIPDLCTLIYFHLTFGPSEVKIGL